MTRNYDAANYEEFRRLASDASLSQHEKIGFPDSYRAGFGEQIFADIADKLTNLDAQQKVVLDIGPGVSDLPHLLIERCRTNHHTLLLVDSPEMLAQLPDEPFIHKFPGLFPRDCASLIEQYMGKIDVVLTYSVLQYAMVDTNLFDFVDKAAVLLKTGGELLIGDIPNVSKRKRFFASETGIAFHRNFTGNPDDMPEVEFNSPEIGKLDDAVLFGLLMRARAAGYDAYLMPQNFALPMANRREDLLIVRP
jgi:hypothetical protein